LRVLGTPAPADCARHACRLAVAWPLRRAQPVQADRKLSWMRPLAELPSPPPLFLSYIGKGQ
jgi:hypothetical protein